MIVAGALLAFLAGPGGALPALEPVPASALRITQGTIRDEGEALRVEGPRLRAEAPGRDGDRAELRFTYLGPSAVTVALASGAERRQLGVRLRGQDACNVLYAMWRFHPEPGVVVQLKRNPEQRTSAECGNEGYVTLRPELSRPVAAPAPGDARQLRADVDGGRLSVRVDGRLVWDGPLPPEAEELRGPAGVRADNARARLVLATAPLRGARPAEPEPGRPGAR